MEAMDIQAVESKLSDVTVTAIPMSGKSVHKDLVHSGNGHTTISTVPVASPSSIIKDNDMVAWSTRCRWGAGHSADSVEWCPVEPYTDLLVCGTYQLEKSGEDQQQTKQSRLGRIYLFRVDDSTTDLTPTSTVETAGILDQKWCYHTIGDHPVLAAVTSDGLLKLYRLVGNSGDVQLDLWMEESIGEDTLALSVDWSTNKLRSSDVKLVVSDSAGKVTVFRVQEKLELVGRWEAHGFEAWIGAFNYWNPDLFYTGGDDCVFKCFDIRVPQTAVLVNRSHEAGVTAVRSSTHVEHQLLTGSYDQHVRVWDARTLTRPLSSGDVRGGVWRLKHHPRHPQLVLAACMYGGVTLLQVGTEVAILKEYTEHASIAYGADWKFGCDANNVVATCSFYDCKMHISDLKL